MQILWAILWCVAVVVRAITGSAQERIFCAFIFVAAALSLRFRSPSSARALFFVFSVESGITAGINDSPVLWMRHFLSTLLASLTLINDGEIGGLIDSVLFQLGVIAMIGFHSGNLYHSASSGLRLILFSSCVAIVRSMISATEGSARNEIQARIAEQTIRRTNLLVSKSGVDSTSAGIVATMIPLVPPLVHNHNHPVLIIDAKPMQPTFLQNTGLISFVGASAVGRVFGVVTSFNRDFRCLLRARYAQRCASQ